MRRQVLQQLAIVFVAGVVVCGVAACGGTAEEATEAAIEAEAGGDVNVDADAGTLTIRGEDGEEMAFTGGADGVELPEDFPSTIPIYPDAQAMQYATMGDTVQAGFQVDAPLNDVRDWYIEQLEDNDWEIQMNMAVADGSMISAELDGQSLSLILGEDDGETTIIVTLGES